MTTLPPLPTPDTHCWDDDTEKDVWSHSPEQMIVYGQQCRDALIALIKRVHSAKGRYHSQIAMCDLYDSAGLKNERPTK